MDTRRPMRAPTMVIVTLLLVVVYVQGYVEQVHLNNRSVSKYAASIALPQAIVGKPQLLAQPSPQFD